MSFTHRRISLFSFFSLFHFQSPCIDHCCDYLNNNYNCSSMNETPPLPSTPSAPSVPSISPSVLSVPSVQVALESKTNQMSTTTTTTEGSTVNTMKSNMISCRLSVSAKPLSTSAVLLLLIPRWGAHILPPTLSSYIDHPDLIHWYVNNINNINNIKCTCNYQDNFSLNLRLFFLLLSSSFFPLLSM